MLTRLNRQCLGRTIGVLGTFTTSVLRQSALLSSQIGLSSAHQNSERDFFSHARMTTQPPIIHDAQGGDTEAIVVFLHGLGDTGDGWAMGFQDRRYRNPKVKYIFPTADTMPVSLNGGYPMTAWFDIYGLDPNAREDKEGIPKAADKIRCLINEQLSAHPNLNESNVILGGFSLGGALALYTSLTQDKPYGGTIALSTWLPMRNDFTAESKHVIRQKDAGLKIFQGHGQADPVVPYAYGKLTSELLKAGKLEAEFETYRGMAHSSCDKEMSDVHKFISKFVK